MSLQAKIIRWILKLPPKWLLRIAGGEPTTIGGRTLDPVFQFLAHGASSQPHMATLSPDEARAGMDQVATTLAPEFQPGVSVSNVAIELKDRSIPARIYRPNDQDPNVPLMVYYHMGGGVIGNLDTCHAFCGILAARVKCPIVSVDYRLAPEHKWPAGLDDATEAYFWALGKAEDLGAPPGRAFLAGDSMGGNFSAIIAQETKRKGLPLPDLQVLIYPALDVSSEYPSTEIYRDAYPLDQNTMDYFMSHYLPEGTDLTNLRLSPILETDLSGLPKALIFTAGFDPLVDQGEEYHKRLKQAGVASSYACYDSLAHGFTAFTGISRIADDACREIADAVRAEFD